MYITTEFLESLCASGAARTEHAPLFDGVEARIKSGIHWYALLLSQTLQYARETVSYYRRTEGLTGFKNLSDLQRAPLLTKADVVTHTRDLISAGATIELLRSTSGTTARRAELYGNVSEMRALNALSTLQCGRPPADEIMLRIVPGTRRLYSSGAIDSMPTLQAAFIDRIPLWFDSADYISQILSTSYLFNRVDSRIRSIHVTPPHLIDKLSRALVEHGSVLPEFQVKRIHMSGGFVREIDRKIVTRDWKAQCASSFSCSEIMGVASELRPGVYSSSSSMFVEVVDPSTGGSVRPGEAGHLVITSLYPFQQVMPLIRYRTGDIAQRLAPDGVERDYVEEFKPLGRMQHCVEISPKMFFGTVHVLRAISEIPQIPQSPFPHYRLSRGEDGALRTLCLEIEGNEMPPDRRAQLAQAIGERMRLAFEQDFGATTPTVLRFQCSIKDKGSLSDIFAIYPDR